MKVGKLGWLVAMFLSGGMAVAQGTVDDYRRAYALKEKFSADKVFYSNVNPQWIEGTHQFWYVRNTPDGRLYVSVDGKGAGCCIRKRGQAGSSCIGAFVGQ